ncbi:MAG TPA: flagellar hook-associated protein 3 [Gammaproteobacteria bacterium]|nr:flagellar hook-associated protein 3 [Gammaproteobacteria bacterium]
MRVSNFLLANSGVQNILKQQAEVLTTQDQISSGKRVSRAQDDPAGMKKILDLESVSATNDQYNKNIDTATNQLFQEEYILDSMTNLLQRARDLSIAAGNAGLNADGRSAIRFEVEQLLSGLLDLTNSVDGNGHYMFSGYATGTKPFSITNGAVNYAGDQGQRQVQIGTGLSLPISDSGYAVFLTPKNGNGTFVTAAAAGNSGNGVVTQGSVVDSAALTGDSYEIRFTAVDTYDVVNVTTGATILAAQSFTPDQSISFDGLQVEILGQPQTSDVFELDPSQSQSPLETLVNFISTLSATQSTDAEKADYQIGLGRALTDIDSAMSQISDVRAQIGSRLNFLEVQKDTNIQANIQIETTLSTVRDLDLTEAISRLSLQTATLQAAQQAYIRTTSLTLFNFLQ